MKNQNQVGKNGSRKAAASQLQNTPNPVRNLPDTKALTNGAVDHRQISAPATLDPKEEMDQLLKERRQLADSPLDIFWPGLACAQRSDEEVLDYVARVVVENEVALSRLGDPVRTGGNDFNEITLLESIIACRAVDLRARWHGLKRTPTLDISTPGPREPLLLDLPGICGAKAYADSDLLEGICMALPALSKEIRDHVLSGLTRRKELELKEVLMIAEVSSHRAGAATELDDIKRDEQTNATKAVWLHKAVCAYQSL